MRRPKCLLADEPFRGIAPLDAEDLTRVFVNLAAQGMAVVITGHDVPTLFNAAHHVYFGGSDSWLDEQLNLGTIHVDLDVYDGGWANAPAGTPGYWNPESSRYQYDGIPILLAEQIMGDELEVAETLVHEAFHEFDARDGIEDYTEDEIELLTRDCAF